MSAVLSPVSPRVVNIFTGLDLDVEVASGSDLDYSSMPVRTLSAGEYLFEQGDKPSHAFQVVEGALSLFVVRCDGGSDLVDIAHPGDFVGLGAVERHACCARAEVAARVRCLSLDDVGKSARTNKAFAARVDAARRGEFELRRSEARRSGSDSPVLRAASFLLVLSRNNAREGRDPTIISDELKCGTVADYLGLSLDELGRAVCDLAKLGLVTAGREHELELIDVAGLERMVDAA